MMNNFRDILIERIGNLDWMSDVTKKAAQKKAAMMKFYIGYPDEWNDDLTPVVEGNTLLEGMASLRLHQKAFMRELTGKSTDTHGWDFWCSLTPFTTYNAMYDTSNNQLIILPVFLTSPLFDLTQSEATLYGTAAVFGHEMCHGFDAGGSKNDEIGAERDWWTAEDKAAFEQKQQQLIDLWGQLEHYPGQPANGQFTLGENMADYGGVTLALEAYTRRLREQGFNGAQFDEQIKKFWLAYGMPISVEERELNVELLKKSYLDDVHSAGHNRVNGIARLFDDWYRLYDVKPTDKLYLAPEDRVKIW
jgi:predicted metalloendopeptidase